MTAACSLLSMTDISTFVMYYPLSWNNSDSGRWYFCPLDSLAVTTPGITAIGLSLRRILNRPVFKNWFGWVSKSEVTVTVTMR